MEQARTAVSAGKSQVAGIVADGAFKLAFAAACAIGAAPLGELLGVPGWLMIAAGAALLSCGAMELGYLRSRTRRTYLRLMIAYDGCWVLATLVALLLARLGSSAGGEVWIGYQAAAPVVFAVCLAAAARPERAAAPDREVSP
ncbi:hypothetical protein SAMN02982929_01001 [Saccharopolyspora kobensis]|uniref:Uncharacterized protein n=1 Tax=Saccharopolyspora kobensis TaxID=146035 RepID=A0A1H5VWF2_9PSEU|nr:hypothetical protein [Saccharopolyspora kobensis]SEF91308.1 hypothetical protein SAMN02982929_01001 [Saccharopolyspora kobensis]SFC56372.1 hypothetical protein SAMN05216506_1011068 [Saccharopolyspora kobensis]